MLDATSFVMATKVLPMRAAKMTFLEEVDMLAMRFSQHSFWHVHGNQHVWYVDDLGNL